MKRIILCALLFVVTVCVLLIGLYALNGSTVQLRQNDTVDARGVASGCALVGWTRSDDGLSFSFRFSVEPDMPPLAVAVSNVSSFVFLCDGQEIYRYSDQEPSARLKIIELPRLAGGVSLRLDFDNPQNSVRAQLGTVRQMNGLDAFGALLFAFCLGCQLLMFMYCLSLWAQKHDEVILAFMMALILLTVARDASQPFALMPQCVPTALKSGLNMSIAATMVLLSAWYVAPAYCRQRARRLPLVLGLVAVMIGLCYGTDGLLFLPFYGICTAVCGATLVYGFFKRVPWTGLMLFALAFFVASFAFYTNVDRGVAPAGTLAVQGYVIQLGCLPFLFACMVAINGRFAGYYRELRRMNAELDALVETRVQQLRVQEEQKHQLMTNVFHDLRSPLFVAKGCVERLKEHRDEAKALSTLKDRIDFMDQLTQDLFTIAKLEDGELLLAEDVVNLTDLCRREGEAARLQCVQKDIEFQSSIESGCFVWGDQLRVGQSVQNLLSNALTHTYSKGRIRLSLEQDDQWVWVSVGNTGEGLPPEDAPHVFERYYRVASGGSNESSGLGLAIVSEIMKAHHGTVELQNAPGEGSVFVLRFPALKQG